MNRKRKLATLLTALVTTWTLSTIAQSLTHRWSFNDTAGSLTFADSVGGADGQVMSNPSASLDGSKLVMDGLGGYGLLPAGMISTNQSVTIEFWASYSSANPVWTRTFSFGDQQNGTPLTVLDYCHYAGGNWQNVNLSTNTPGGATTWANNQGGLNGLNNQHVTVIVDPPNGRMYYYNGTSVRSQAGYGGQGIIYPLSAINDAFGAVGRSFYDVDPTLNGTVDEVRVYNGILSRHQIILNDAAGPDSIVTNEGALQTVQLTAPAPTLVVGGNEQLVFTGNFANVSNVDLIAYGGSTFGSANPSVLTVNSTNGLVSTLGLGTTTVTATNGGLTSSATITVVQVPATLQHRYSFTADANDSVGNAHGTLEGGAFISGGAVVLPGGPKGSGDVSIPGNLVNIATNTAITVDLWATAGDVQMWSRLWEFGNGVSNDHFLAGATYGAATFGPNGEVWPIIEAVPGGGTIRTGIEPIRNTGPFHMTLVMDSQRSTIAYYLNGVFQFGRYDAPADFTQVATNFVHLGFSSAPPDPDWAGSVDEFRIYSGALTAPEIAVAEAVGPNSTARDPGALQSIEVQAATYPAYSGRLAPNIRANYANLPNFNMFPNTSVSVFGMVLTSSDPNVLEVLANNSLRSHAPGKATLTASYQGKTSSAVITVQNLGSLTHRYSFTADATDSVGGAGGTVNSPATIAGGAVQFSDDKAGYVDLPPALLQGYSAVTIDTWVTFNNPMAWSRIWDFGGYQGNSIYSAPNFNSGGFKGMVGSDAGQVFYGIFTGTAFTTESLHLTFVEGNGTVEWYTNGVAVGTIVENNFNATIPKLQDVATNYCRLGWSPYPADPGCNCSMDEFRIYRDRLSPNEILASDVLGPNQVLNTSAPAVRIGSAGGNATLSWPVANAGFVVQSAASLNSGSWVTLTNNAVLVGSTWQVTLPQSTQQQFYRLWR